jgi:hypothetical protein
MLEKSRFTVRTRVKSLPVGKQRRMFEWLDKNFSEDNWHYRVSKQWAAASAVFFRNEKQKLIFDLAWSDIILSEIS